MITYFWSTLLLRWLLLLCNYVHFFDHLLVHFFGHSYWHISDINSLILWDFHNFPEKSNMTINYFYIDIWKLNITKLISIKECFVVIYTYSRKTFLGILLFEWFFFVVVCFCYCTFDKSHWPLLWKCFM